MSGRRPLNERSFPSSARADEASAEWRLLALVDIANFTGLRRQCGTDRAERVVDLVAESAGRVTGALSARRVGRSLVELVLAGDSLGQLEGRLDRMEAALAQPIDLEGDSHPVELIVAAAGAPRVRGMDDVRMAEAAEEALATAREERRRVVRDAAMAPSMCEATSLRSELALAIAREQVFLQYQPKLHVRRQEVASAEALVRWNHPSRGLIYPGDFIGIAEQSGLIGPLTLWTLRRVIADQHELRGDGHDLPIFINISGQLLGDERFIAEACAIVAASDARIGFEITETSMIGDPQTAIEHLKIVAAHGVPIAIDDYGAGLSSLAYLKRLPATELKIDKMFVMELTSSHRDPLIVRSTIDLAHAMEMEVTAEGVETPAALALLSVMGCDLVQGFLLSRPLSLGAFRQYLAGETGLPLTQPAYGLRSTALRKRG